MEGKFLVDQFGNPISSTNPLNVSLTGSNTTNSYLAGSVVSPSSFVAQPINFSGTRAGVAASFTTTNKWKVDATGRDSANNNICYDVLVDQSTTAAQYGGASYTLKTSNVIIGVVNTDTVSITLNRLVVTDFKA